MSKVTRFNFDDHYQVSPDLNGKHVFLTFADYEALRERAEQAERDRDVLARAIDNIAKEWTPKHVVNSDLDKVVVEAFIVRQTMSEFSLTRCTPASREGATLDDGHGNQWRKCGPNCTLDVVRPGEVQCEGECKEVKP